MESPGQTDVALAQVSGMPSPPGMPGVLSFEAAEPHPSMSDGMSLAEKRTLIIEAYCEHRASMYVIARRVCGVDRAAEVIHEVFLRLWEQPDLFDPVRGPLRALLLIRTRSKAIDVLRQDNARRKRDDRDCRQRATGVGGIDTEVARNHNAEQVVAALQSLHPDVRDAIVTAFYGGITYQAVAELRGVPVGTIKSRIRRGLRELHALLLTDPAPVGSI